ncbi:divalent-cation tolerance protein CutA [Chitinimonas taiwanensis]|nr:divalent-cation tolerance protein CutA [Chitinimonas taiwanensis]
MLEPDSVLLVLCNAPDTAFAESLARTLLERRLAACVNLLPVARSLYQWQGQIETADEIPMLIKTTAAQYAALQAAIQGLHPYAVPEIIALPVVAGLPAYLDWVAAETGSAAA